MAEQRTAEQRLVCPHCPARFSTEWEREVHEKEHPEQRFSPGTEFNRNAVKLLGDEFIRWRNPPVELPAASVIEKVVETIALAAASEQQAEIERLRKALVWWREQAIKASGNQPLAEYLGVL